MSKLTTLDRKLLAELEGDPRRTNKDLARYLRVTEATVSARIKRMEQDDLIRIIPMHDFAMIGHSALAVLDIDISGRDIDSVITALSAIDQVLSVIMMSGTPSIIITVTERDERSLLNLILSDIAQAAGVHCVEANVIVEILKWQTGYGLIGTIDKEPSFPPELMAENIDLCLLHHLGPNGRMSNRQLARLAGVSADTVRQRIMKLEEAGLLHFRLVVDAPSVPLEAMAYVRIKAEPKFTRSVAQTLRTIPSCSFVGLSLGRYSIIALFNAATRKEIVRVISVQVTILPGIRAINVREPAVVAKNNPYRARLVD